jgi:hypothetical protein
MSKFLTGLAVLVVAGGAAGLWLQHEDNRRLRADVAALRQEIRNVRLPERTAESSSMQRATTAAGLPPSGESREELTKLREEIAALRKSTQALNEFAQAAQAASALKTLGSGDSAVPTKLKPAEALKNAGRSTPEAATETVLWAAVGGDVESLANSMVLTPTARDKADAWFAGLSESTRQQYGSPEKIIALMIAKDAAGLVGMQVLGQKEVAPDNVGVRIRFGSADGKTKDDSLLMRRVNDGWRLVMPDTAVEKFARQLAGK